MLRIRHCVECSKCLTWYVVSCNPYENGSYLLPTIEGCWDEYTLYCRCKAAASRWKSSEFKSCEVSAAAFERGYGTPEEIKVIRAPQQEWSVDVSRYLRQSVRNWAMSAMEISRHQATSPRQHALLRANSDSLAHNVRMSKKRTKADKA
jgi:hypothetical protein